MTLPTSIAGQQPFLHQVKINQSLHKADILLKILLSIIAYITRLA